MSAGNLHFMLENVPDCVLFPFVNTIGYLGVNEILELSVDSGHKSSIS